MAGPAHLRLHGPSRGAVALATAALVAVTSGATALIVLSTTGGVGGTSPGLTPLPPVLAAGGGLPVVVLPPGALGTGLPSVAPTRTGTTSETSPVSTSVSTAADGSVSGSTDSAATRSVRLAAPVLGGAPGVRPLGAGQRTAFPAQGPAQALPLERPVTAPVPPGTAPGDDVELLERDRQRRARGGSQPLAQPVVDADPRDLDTGADRFDLSRDDDEPVVAVPLSVDPDADGPTTGHVPGSPKGRAVPAIPGSAAGPAVRATPPGHAQGAGAPAQKAAPVKQVAPVRTVAPAQKASPVKKAAPVEKAAPVKKAAPAQKAAPVTKAPPVKKAAPAKGSSGKVSSGRVKARDAAPGKASRSRGHSR